jgi:hypothetical protein
MRDEFIYSEGYILFYKAFASYPLYGFRFVSKEEKEVEHELHNILGDMKIDNTYRQN